MSMNIRAFGLKCQGKIDKENRLFRWTVLIYLAFRCYNEMSDLNPDNQADDLISISYMICQSVK